MIKLTIQPDSPHSFDKNLVIIGSQGDLALPQENLEPIHIKIMEVEGRFLMINHVNDPFVTLNGAPFAKRTLKNGDLLQIGETSIQFEGSLLKGQEELEEILEKALHSRQSQPSLQAHSLHSSFEDLDLEKELEQLAEFEELAKGESRKGESKEDFVRPSLKDFDIAEEPLLLPEPPSDEKRWNWKIIISLASILFILALLLALFFYFSMKAKNRDDELKVTEALSDISMALTYAKFNHIQPRNQNWTDPEFLKNNLIAVLASEYSPITAFDMHGLFNNSNYILRVYNSSDLAHYLIIAQPAPSLSQWVLPRAAIVVDSREMELHKMHDLKALNRLLLNLNPLDSSADEVSELIKQGRLYSSFRTGRKDSQTGLQSSQSAGPFAARSRKFNLQCPPLLPFWRTVFEKDDAGDGSG